MSMQAIRESLKTYIETKTRIDTWDIDEPSNRATAIFDDAGNVEKYLPANCAFFDPIADVNYQKMQNGVTCLATFRYYINYRFPYELSLQELPIAQLEELQQYLITSLILSSGCLGTGIKDINVTREEYPLMVRRIQGEDNDWLITLMLPFTVNFISKPGDSFPDISPPIDSPNWQVRRIAIDIWKRSISPPGDDLDRTFTQDYEEVE